jgi:hypothetical protein
MGFATLWATFSQTHFVALVDEAVLKYEKTSKEPI